MSLGVWFWIGMFFWLLVGIFTTWRAAPERRYDSFPLLLVFVLMVLLGIKTFGSPITG